MLITRFYTAFFLLGILIPTFIWAPFDILRGLVALGMAICAWEWSRLFQLDSWLVKMYASAVGATVFFLLDIRFNFFIGLLYYSACFWLFFVPFLLWKHPLLRSRIWCFFFLINGLLLLYIFGLTILSIAQLSKRLLFFILMLVWIADTGAFFSGRFFGGAKLAPEISPRKTWSGVVGGYISMILATFLIVFWHYSSLSWILDYKQLTGRNFFSIPNLAIIFVILSLFFCLSVMGDLFESLMKRYVGVKDSSSLLPGHGGVLDRIDSLLPVLPMVMLLLNHIKIFMIS